MNDYHHNGLKTSRQSGYSLFEVLIAVVVTSIGLLGLAGIQATGLSNNLSAYQRSQATVLAYDISDRMRANYCIPTTSIPPCTLPTGDDTSLQYYLSTNMPATDAEEQPGCKNTDGCNFEELAENDLFEWNLALTTALPGAIGTITVDDRGTGLVDDDIYVISISWDDRNFVDPDPDDEIDNLNFQMSFQP